MFALFQWIAHVSLSLYTLVLFINIYLFSNKYFYFFTFITGIMHDNRVTTRLDYVVERLGRTILNGLFDETLNPGSVYDLYPAKITLSHYTMQYQFITSVCADN